MAISYVPAKGPKDFDARFRDVAFADEFRVIAEVLEATESDSERVTLLISTCRNLLMTVNAVFVDVREVVGASTLPSPLGSATHDLVNGDYRNAEKGFDRVAALLAAARLKIAVWVNRYELVEKLDSAISSLPLETDHERARVILGWSASPNQVSLGRRPTSLDVQTADGYAEDLLELLKTHHDHLVPLVSLLRPTTALLLRLPDEVSADAHLFTPPPTTDDNVRVAERNARVGSLLAALDEAPPGWVTRDGDAYVLNGVRVDREIAHSRTDLRDLAAALAQRATELQDDVRSDLRRKFRANSSRLPMPAPFEVDLTTPVAPDPSFLQNLIVRGRDLELTAQPRVAALSCGIAEGWYEEHDSVYRFHPQRADLMTSVVRDALRAAASNGCQLVAFPEVALPTSALEDIASVAADFGLVVVGGQEMFRDDRGIVNRAVVMLPSGPRHEQRKQRPSVYEVRQSDFSADGIIRIFQETTVGTFAVVLCSDYLEEDVMAEVNNRCHVDLVVVCARNPHPDVFRALAVADSYRKYAHVFVVNARPDDIAGGLAATSDGTLVAAPRRLDPILAPIQNIPLGYINEFSPSLAPSLDIYELSGDAIAHRMHNRPNSGYLPPSHRARSR